MAKPRFFTTLPARAIGDTRPTALDLRCLAVIAKHDGMSKVKGSGGGCYARRETLAQQVQTDVSNFSKSISRLIKWGYLVREPQLMDKRRFTLRVIYAEEGGELATQLGGEAANDDPEIGGETGNDRPEIGGEAEDENGGFSRQITGHYISLNEELDFDESKEINSLKGPVVSFSDDPEADPRPTDLVPNLRSDREEINTPEGGLTSVLVLSTHLPRNFASLPLGAQVARLDAAYTKIGRDPTKIGSRERDALTDMLFEIFDSHMGGELDAVAQQAARLREDLLPW